MYVLLSLCASYCPILGWPGCVQDCSQNLKSSVQWGLPSCQSDQDAQVSAALSAPQLETESFAEIRPVPKASLMQVALQPMPLQNIALSGLNGDVAHAYGDKHMSL